MARGPTLDGAASPSECDRGICSEPSVSCLVPASIASSEDSRPLDPTFPASKKARPSFGSSFSLPWVAGRVEIDRAREEVGEGDGHHRVALLAVRPTTTVPRPARRFRSSGRSASPARSGSDGPVRGGSRRPRPLRRGRLRARRARWRSVRADPPAWPSGGRRRRCRGSRRWRKRKPSSPANCGRSERISCRRTSAARRGVTCVSSGVERLHGAAVEDLALDRPALQHPPLGRVELVEARRQQRLQRRRHLDLAVPPRWLIATISLMNSGLPAAAAAILAPQLLRHASPIRLAVSSLSGLEPHGHRPGGAAVEQLRAAPCRAAESEHRLERSATCSIRSRNVSSPHWMSSNTTTSGACSSSSFRNAQPISSAEVPPRSHRATTGSRPRQPDPTATRRAA